MKYTGYELYHRKWAYRPDFPCSCNVINLPEDEPVIPLHHHDEVEFILVREGEGTVSIDLEPYEAKAGTILVILPNQLHAVECKEGKKLVITDLTFRLDLLESQYPDYCNSSYFDPIRTDSVPLPCCITADYPEHGQVRKCITDIDSLCRWVPEAWQLSVKARLFQLFYILYYNKTAPAARTRPRKSLERALRLSDYLTENCSMHLTVPEMAQKMELSESQFMKFFRSAFCMTFIDYVNDCRLIIAAILLTGTDKNIQDVAVECGVPNIGHFNRIFKKKYGVTPSRYRKTRGNL